MPIEFIQNFEADKREDEMMILTRMDQQIQAVFGELEYIVEILETHKNIAPVENIRKKIKDAYDRIKTHLDPNAKPEQEAGLEANRRAPAGFQVEQNPLINDLGGMPLEVISPEWSEMVEGNILDKAEMENLINKKLKDRAELANKLKLQNKLKAQPKLQATPKMTPKFTKTLKQTLEYIVKETPPPPAPKYSPSKPRPY